MAFLRACSVREEQVVDVMELWSRLSGEVADARVARAGGVASAQTPPVEMAGHFSRGDVNISTIHRSGLAELVELLRYVVADERRTNRALRLMGRSASLMVPLLAFTAVVLMRLPQPVAVWTVVGTCVVMLGAVVLAAVKLGAAVRRERTGDD
ncbi:hypothetical protein [Saccharothrix luteola]|uniref:hypothetical protein n=1 Tax=Saccharothrix luteola TaxID=2893018 RepID=UPI001E57623B|nr:hypothetical protein [Saccharothrix luteola]MCC8247639.1 hypothetical protein [Saccharothrix luteola]